MIKRNCHDITLWFMINIIALLILAGCNKTMEFVEKPAENPSSIFTMGSIIPMPDSVQLMAGSFLLRSNANIYVNPITTEITAIGQYLADKLNASTGYEMHVINALDTTPEGNVYLTTVDGDPSLGEEGYILKITEGLVTVVAYQPTGLFRGIQTLRQLLPPLIESSTVQNGPWGMAAVNIRDYPRFQWRGAMLDVARHFFTVQEVKRFIDLMAFYKLNRLHIHLTDDQGWRIMINSWPNLATFGGSTAVGGDNGGYYTQADYSDIVAYAQSRYIMVIPEIDMPGHVSAAQASYAELNCSGIKTPLYTGIDVGFSALCINSEITYTFANDVIGEIAEITPGPYIHIGGDEASTTIDNDYINFIDRVQNIVHSHNKLIIGWEEIAKGHLLSNSLAQHWNSNLALVALQQGAKVIMSPASKAYLDMMYNSSTTIGQNWAGYIEVKDAYCWDPSTELPGVTESDIMGIEAPLWTETIRTLSDIEYMTFPRLACYAEIGWSPKIKRNWEEFSIRLGMHGSRLTAMGVNYYKSPQVSWK